MRRLFKLSLIFFSIGLVFFSYKIVQAADQNSFLISVSKDIVSESGFEKAELIKSANGRFSAPIFYFKVKESASVSTWGDSADVLAVSIIRHYNPDWVFNGGGEQVVNMEGRFQVNAATTGYYISVTGPDLQKVMTLSKKLKVLY